MEAAVPIDPGASADPDAVLPAADAVFVTLARSNSAVSMTVRRDGAIVLGRATGSTVGAGPATSDSPMVVASVSKFVTAYSISKLHEQGLVDLIAPVPWGALGIQPNAGWYDVTVRELLDHTSGMPIARTSWFTGQGDCASYLPALLAAPPQPTRGRWTYSNGNYCALGLLIETVTGLPLDVAAQQLAFDPLGVDGIHLTTDGLGPADVPHAPRVDRLSRLGGAGTFVVSTDDLTALLSAMTLDDFDTIRWPAVMLDQYGWGHTGTIDGAKACVWVLEGGRTTVAVTIAGNSVSTGGALCDRIVPALAVDLGIGIGERPDRTPP